MSTCVYAEGTFFSFVVIMSMMCVSVYMMLQRLFLLSPPSLQSVDDLPVVSDKGRARGEHGVKNAVKIHQLN